MKMQNINDSMYIATKENFKIDMNDSWFKTELLKILETNGREEAYQSYLVYPMIQSILNMLRLERQFFEYELIDSHNFHRKNTTIHDRSFYSALACAVPDLIIAKDFYYENRKEDCAKYAIAVEVKEINSEEMLDKKFDFENQENMYPVKLLVQLLPQIYKKQLVIATNLRVWEFIRQKDKIESKNCECYKKIEEFMKIIEICGIDDFELSANETWFSEKLKELIALIDNKLIDNKYKRDIHEKMKKKDLERIMKCIVEDTIEKYKLAIKSYYEKCCEIKTVIFLNNQKKYILDRNVKRHNDKLFCYISGIADISYDTDAPQQSICELLCTLKENIEPFITK